MWGLRARGGLILFAPEGVPYHIVHILYYIIIYDRLRVISELNDIFWYVDDLWYGCALSLVRLPCGAGGSPASLIETQKLLLSRGF